MKVRPPGSRWAPLGALATMALGVGAGGCVPRLDDVNQVQPGYVKKAIFQSDDEWYYRRTIAKSETTNAYIIEGHGDIALERVKFEIQEDLLIAYQAYENLPGTSLAEVDGDGNEFYRGPVLAAWPITSHFDIARSYDALTGNETPVVSENTVDRPWDERDYMRVNWASNLIEGSIFADYSGYWFPVSYVSTQTNWQSIDMAPTDPFATRISDDYLEINNQAMLGMDLLMCAAMTGYSFAGFTNCGFGEAQVRHAFMRVTEPTDYIPRDYPDSYVKKGPDGQPIYDPETGEVEREPIYNRFGIFRIETPTYDRGYGFTESGRLFRAMLFDIWENHTDGMGNELPFAERTEKPIIYYLNAEYPARYRQAAAEVADEYNRVYTRMVADLKGLDLERAEEDCGDNGVACMFEIRDNACNEANITSFVSERPELLYAVERAVCAEGEACGLQVSDIPDRVGVGNLKRVCTSLEAATLDPATGKPEFEWQRIGDPRFNMVVWLNNPQRSPWGGYGPMHADARTGRVVSATSFLRGNSYEVGSANIVDYIALINDEKSVDDIVYGQDIRRHIAEASKRGQDIAETVGSPAFSDRLDARMDRLGRTQSELLQEVPNSRHQLNRLERINGTRLEERLITNWDLAVASDGTWRPTDGPPSEELKRRASPIGRLTETNPTSPLRLNAQAALGAAGYCFLEQQFDPHWAGLALALKDVPREEQYRIVANRMIKHVMLHELGHNVGLAHNFEGSYDAMNYEPEFWRLEDATAEEKIAGQQDEFRNTTVMEYLSAKGAFSDFLGKYDEAAIRFAYGNQIQVFDGPNVDPNLDGGEDLRAWRYLNDYRDIPDHLCGASGCTDANQRMAVLSERKWVDFDVDNPPPNEVPYLFCDNYYNRRTPFCATFDYGSNLREIFSNYYVMWSEYFFFNNFARDRLSPLSWSPARALTPAFLAMNFLDTTAQYFYFLNATQGRDFRETDLHEDMAATLAQGLNMAAEVISTPDPARMCPFEEEGDTVFIPHFFFRSGCDEYAPLGSELALEQQQIELPLGDARPASLDFTEDYEDFQLRFIGSYFDKSNVVFLLGQSNPRLFRFNYDLDFRNYFISLYRLFEPELRQFYDDLVNFDGWLLTADTARNLGSFWCRDPDAPDRADLGYFEPKKMIDLVSNTSLPGPSETCQQPAFVWPRLLFNMPDNAMVAAHALFSSDFDAQLDMGKNMKVYVRGADDDFPAWADFPNCESAPADTDCYCALTDLLTGLEYRAVQFADPATGEPAAESVGCRLIAKAQEAQDNWEITQQPRDMDRWRYWIERLENARDLYRIFHGGR